MAGAFTAGNDVVFLGSVGDMTALATAGNNIGTVMTYGSFGGALSAGGACPTVPTTPEDVAACGGQSVLARSDLGGSITQDLRSTKSVQHAISRSLIYFWFGARKWNFKRTLEQFSLRINSKRFVRKDGLSASVQLAAAVIFAIVVVSNSGRL